MLTRLLLTIAVFTALSTGATAAPSVSLEAGEKAAGLSISGPTIGVDSYGLYSSTHPGVGVDLKFDFFSLLSPGSGFGVFGEVGAIDRTATAFQRSGFDRGYGGGVTFTSPGAPGIAVGVGWHTEKGVYGSVGVGF